MKKHLLSQSKFNGPYLKLTTFLRLYGFFPLPFLMIMTVFSPTLSYTQNISGLEGKKLTKLDDIGSAVVSLFGSKDLEGDIKELIVTWDSENKLGFKMKYTGFETAYLRVQVLGPEKSNQNDVSKIEKDLTGTKDSLQLDLLLKEDLQEGTYFESPFLEVKISKSKDKFGGKVFLYSLHKKWQENINPENLVINIQPEPIGKAASLKANEEQIIMPSKNQKFLINKSLMSEAARHATNRNFIRASGMEINTTDGSAMDGTWINIGNTTRGISKVVISNAGKKIQVFGSCHPQDCDWGEKPLAVQNNGSYYAFYDQNFASSKLYLRLNDNILKLQDERTYSDNRPIQNNIYTFSKYSIGDVKHATLNYYSPVKPVLLNYPLALNKEEVDKGAQGPSDNPLSLWEDLKTDVDFESPTEITNIGMEIYEDKNPASGVYYYLPAAYHLKWNEDDGFGLKILYGTADGNSAGNVHIASSLTPNISTKEIDFITELLKAHIAKDKKFDKLRLMPLQETPQISFISDLNSQYEIPAEKVSVNVTSSIKEPIIVSWVTDSKVKQEMQVALLENVGIQGTMTLKPQSDLVPPQLIPVKITLADQATLGRLDLTPVTWRTKSWRNKTPYPVRLKKLHMLLLVKEGNNTIPLIYSWDLHDEEIPSMANVVFNDTKVPAWLDQKAKRIWMDYAVVPCEECDKKVIEDITSGTSGNEIKNITFETFKVMETTGAAFLQVKARSTQGDPGGNNQVEFPALRIAADTEGQTTGPLYVPEGEAPELEYFITLVMPDGQDYKADDWVKTSEVEIFLGVHDIQEAISSLPQNEAPDPRPEVDLEPEPKPEPDLGPGPEPEDQ